MSASGFDLGAIYVLKLKAYKLGFNRHQYHLSEDVVYDISQAVPPE